MKKRIILITIDCLRRDRLSIYGCKKDLTPNIDNLCENALIFNNAIANGSYTPPSFYALFLSEIPGLNGNYTPLPLGKATLSRILQKSGFVTCGIHSNPHLGKISNFHFGFDDFFDMYENPEFFTLKKRLINDLYEFLEVLGIKKFFLYLKKRIIHTFRLKRRVPSFKTKKINAPYLNAKNITLKAIEWLQSNYNSNFFLWIHYMDVHRPYYPPSNFIKKISNIEITNTMKVFLKNLINEVDKNPLKIKKLNEYIDLTKILYNAEIRYTDFYIGVLLKFLKRLKIFESIDIIITADHGEALFEHDFLGHKANLYDELLRIPLIFKLDKLNQKQMNVEDQVELIDIAPTILDISQLPKEVEFKGTSLIPLIQGEKDHLHSEYAISTILHDSGQKLNAINKDLYHFKLLISCRTLEWKLICNFQDKNIKLFNLKNDPLELNDLNDIYDDKEILMIKKSFLERINKYIEKEKSEQKRIKGIAEALRFKLITENNFKKSI